MGVTDSAQIHVAANAEASLALRGGLGPIVEGQTVTKAMVTLQDLQLVDTNGRSVPIIQGTFTTDLVSLQNDLLGGHKGHEMAYERGRLRRPGNGA